MNWTILLLCILLAAVLCFAVVKLRRKGSGQENGSTAAAAEADSDKYLEMASAVLKAVGGRENVTDVGYCTTRLRFELKNSTKVDEKAVKAAGATSVIRSSKTTCQVIIGTKAKLVYDALKKQM